MKRFLIIAGVVSALAVGIVAVAGAGAQEATPEASDEPAATEEDSARAERVDHYLELLAGNLGVSVEDLEAALTQTQLDLVAEKVADGTLTQEEADAIIERIESGEGRLFPPFFGGHHHGPVHRIAGNIFEAAAEVLGMDVDALHQQVRDGNSLADVAESQGVDVETFKADLLTALQANIAEKVADGTITQEMADRISANLEESIDRIVEKVPGEGPWGDGMERPFRGGPGFFNGPLGGDTETEATTTSFFIN